MDHDIISKCNLHYNLNSHDFYHIKPVTLQFTLKPRSTFTAPHQHHITFQAIWRIPAGHTLAQTVFVSGPELLSQRTYLCAVWKWYMVFSFREVRECRPSSLRNISRPVCPGPVLMTSSPLRNALNQKAARGRAHFIWLSLFPSLIPFLSLSEKSCQSFTLSHSLGKNLLTSFVSFMFTLSLSFVFSLTDIHQHWHVVSGAC